MCGFAGFLGPASSVGGSRQHVNRMCDAIAHRGPDGHDVWIDTEAGVGLGHRRLSIIDLSAAGAQPMHSSDGRWVITFNGEIYNVERLRQSLELDGLRINWRGHSDTEVLIEAIAHWGFEKALQSTIGMFAFALWDRQNRRLFLARDRVGEKPIYYGWCRSTLLFGSELKALREHSDFSADLDMTAVTAYFRYGYVPSPRSIYTGISKLPPAHFVAFDQKHREPQPTRYWSPTPDTSTETDLSDPDRTDEALDALLGDAVALQMRADVPMGAFLSGGVDSSLIVSLMQRHSRRPVKTFTIGFEEMGFNEAAHAAAVASHLGTDHHEMIVTAKEARAVVPLLPAIYDEPFADSSQIPTYLLSKLTRRHVTVSLSGDGGDELFGGYTRYFQARQFARVFDIAPTALRQTIAVALHKVPPHLWRNVADLAPRRFAEVLAPTRIAKALAALSCTDLFAVYLQMVTLWEPAQVIADCKAGQSATLAIPPIGNPILWMMATDFQTYLPDDILVKVDRASMAVSLESRVPLLDHRVIELARRIPFDQKIGGGKGKLALRRLLYRYVPQNLIERPKQGFSLPIGEWLRGPLRDWAEDLLEDRKLVSNGLLPAPIRRAWETHVSGGLDLSAKLWTVLMYQAWRSTP